MSTGSDREQEGPDAALQREELMKLIAYRMPFGKYKGRFLLDLPEPYVVWFRRQGFPRGELGRMMGLLYEIKANGLEGMLRPLRDQSGPGTGSTD